MGISVTSSIDHSCTELLLVITKLTKCWRKYLFWLVKIRNWGIRWGDWSFRSNSFWIIREEKELCLKFRIVLSIMIVISLSGFSMRKVRGRELIQVDGDRCWGKESKIVGIKTVNNSKTIVTVQHRKEKEISRSYPHRSSNIFKFKSNNWSSKTSI